MQIPNLKLDRQYIVCMRHERTLNRKRLVMCALVQERLHIRVTDVIVQSVTEEGELVTDSKEVTLREIDVPREVTAIRLIANKANSGLLKYVLSVPHRCHSGKNVLEKELFATIEEAQAYCDEEATNDACKAFALENCKGY